MKSFEALVLTINKDNLRVKEIKLIDFIRSNLQEIVENNMKIEDLVDKAGVGYSAIYNLMHTLGIKGYRDLMLGMMSDWEIKSKIKNNNDVRLLYNVYAEILKHNDTEIKKSDIKLTINTLFNSKRLFFIYWENSIQGPIKEMFNYFYQEKQGSCWLLDSDDETLQLRIKDANANDTFMFFSRYGTSTRLEKRIKEIYSKKSKIIYVSGNKPSKSIEPSLTNEHILVLEKIGTDHVDSYISKSLSFTYFNDLLITQAKKIKGV